MNNRLHQQPPNKPRILVNGCSHTSAIIPDNLKGPSWGKIFCNSINAELINIAFQGKSNNIILEETIRYLINDDDIKHVVIYYTDWRRYNFYCRNKSFKWIPGDFKSQFENLQPGQLTHNDRYYVRMHPPTDEITIRRDFGPETRSIGDISKIHEIIVCGTLTYCLHELCLSKNIGLTLINLNPILDSKEDMVWSKIPNDLFLFSNNGSSSISQHYYDKYEKPDNYHYEQKFHYELADRVTEHYKSKIQIQGNIKKIKESNFIYDYTN
jgi:hypothetical protein